jgi:6-pyruvoyltetrahydropterin/6-carboxytetrahydropterin synthase
MREKTLKIHRGSLRFASGHFTIFSKTSREKMHGHNYYVEAEITAAVDEAGITFDYRLMKNKLLDICAQLNTYFLLPMHSPYLAISESGDYIEAIFDGKKLFFLKEDVKLLPIRNITLEELSDWFAQEIMSDKTFIQEHKISKIRIHVYNGLEQSSCGEAHIA